MDLMVQFDGAAVGSEGGAAWTGAHQAVSALGCSLRAVHPGTSDPNLRRWFAVSVPDAGQAARLAEALRVRPEVTAAYVKPTDEAP
ncbi:hypothetical protein [Methylobacterium trifolii]|uniref:SPOR domain-containing protein n=1 Tax=Methylobacterium trifolii TaxID=1003092 RepID=A0ABQ4U4L3_9HYPH|nr:hypothetical protein [Methylobacterium trifolii]GJE62049.1 hypothetical protein MPOCJGCO_4178 [Methylobacterium trifolii]